MPRVTKTRQSKHPRPSTTPLQPRTPIQRTEAPKIHVRIRSTLDNREKIRFFELDRDATFSMIKELIYQRASIPIENQKLQFRNEVFDDTSRLQDKFTTDHPTIDLVVSESRLEASSSGSQSMKFPVLCTFSAGLAGEQSSFQVDVQSTTSVSALRKLLAEQTQLPCESQRIKHAGIYLSDGDVLSDYDIKAGSALWIENQPKLARYSLRDYPEAVYAFAAQDMDDAYTSYLFHFSVVAHWFPMNEGFVIGLGPATSIDAFSIVVTRETRPVFILVVNPSDTTHASACHSFQRGLMSIERQHPRQRLVGVNVIGTEWMLWSVGGAPNRLRRIGGWRQHLESEESFRVLSLHVSAAKLSSRLI